MKKKELLDRLEKLELAHVILDAAATSRVEKLDAENCAINALLNKLHFPPFDGTRGMRNDLEPYLCVGCGETCWRHKCPVGVR